MRRAALLATLFFSVSALAEFTEKVTCKDAPDQSYALFVPLSYNAAIAPGSNVTFGFCGNATGSNYHPTITSVSLGVPLGSDISRPV